ncbi:11008_t:CDS:2, partial [Racocetra persica]
FWENTENPSLKNFLDFRSKEGNLEDEETEHLRYKCELNTIRKYYSETSEMGQKILRWMQDFKVRKGCVLVGEHIINGSATLALCCHQLPCWLRTGRGKGCVLVGKGCVRAYHKASTTTLRVAYSYGKYDKKSEEIKQFWDLQNGIENVHTKKMSLEEKNKLENQIDLEQERTLLQKTITNKLEKLVSDDNLQPV